MKSIQVSDELHVWLIDQKNSKKRSINAVISDMRSEIEELKEKYDASVEMMLDAAKK